MAISIPFTAAKHQISSAQLSNENVVAAPAAGSEIVVWQMYISLDTATKLTADDGAGGDDEWEFNAAANGGQVLQASHVPLFTMGDGNALDLTTDASVSGFVKLWYTIEEV